MNGYTIVHIEADTAAISAHDAAGGSDMAAPCENILQQFNEYMQTSAPHTQSFVTGTDGYFRLQYNEKVSASSAAIESFGTFLVSSGYRINNISSAKTSEGADGTLVRFSRDKNKEESVVLSTLNVY